MLATTAALITTLGAPISAGPPDLRYELSRQPELGPVVRDLRYYPPTPAERPGLRSFKHLPAPRVEQASVTEQALDPAAGRSTLRWHLPSSAWSVVATAHIWTDNGSRWIHLEGRRKYDLVTGHSVFEIDLDSVPGHLYVDSIEVAIEWRPIPTGGSWVDTNRQTTQVYISESRLPSDFDRDGVLCIADLNAYMDAFLVHAPRADLNRNGAVDAEDLRIYLATFEANYRP